VGDGWNNKRSDMRQLTDYCSKEIFKGIPLAWQIFDEVNQFHDTDMHINLFGLSLDEATPITK
jgi:hypothetical protein